MRSGKAYAEIDGVQYTQAGTHVFPEGTSITVFCYCAYIFFADSASKITMNGTIVKKAEQNGETIQFTFPLSGKTSIDFIKKAVGNQRNYHCDITTS